MDLKRIFDILGIEITKSELVIKRAYQEKVKEVHPEERPMEWQELHQAYKDALSYAKGYLWFLDEFNDEIEVLDKENNQERPVDSDEGFDKEFHGDLDGNIEQELDEGRDEEEDVYHSLFTDLYVSGEKTRQENMTQVMKYFESIVNAYPGSHDWQLIDFLKSPLFRSCWEEELVLFYLKRALEQVKNPKIASQISEVLEEMIEHLTGTMETSKVNQIKEMLASNRKKEPTSKKDKWLKWIQEPKIVTGTAVIMGFIILILIAIGSNPGDHTHRFILSEAEARELMIAHLEDKYGFAGLDPEGLTLRRHILFRMEPAVQVGFRGEIGRSVGELILIAWEEEGQIIAYVFDDLQLSQINYDLGTVLLQELDFPEGEVFMSSDQGIFRLRQRYFFEPSWAGFHTHYNGDLQQFFEEEAKIRNRIIHGLFTNEVAVNPNGRATLYIRDPEIGTMSDRLKNRDGSHLEVLEEVLAAKAEIYQIQILALVLPQSYYDDVFLAATVDKYLRNHTLNAIRSPSIIEGAAPILSPLLTGWYHSKDERFSSRFFMTAATEITDGVFVIKQSSQARLGLDPITVKRSESIDEVEEYLRSSGVLFTNSVNLSISGPSYEGYILLDIEKLGIPVTNYTIANVSFRQDGEIRQITRLDISTTIRENFEEPRNIAIVDGYLIIPPGARFVSERMITIVYW